ncbi:hypothetical protein OAO74_00520 [Euryarchaeota archaeon]|jgi:hypothetical protein|nr:hypothetical protein [Euryarchaeota archaeon]|tara:strand:+ start:167 stop:547 length:381 start_codon:yes stop_codon:yes gene_type:complete
MDTIGFLKDIRNATIANSAILIFHIWVAFEFEGMGFLVMVIILGAIVAGAYYTKGKIGAALLALPTLGYILLTPELVSALTEDPGIMEYILIPFWWATTIMNCFVIYAEATGNSKYAKASNSLLEE